jgi:2-polyprenyl-3-methyl-5-hydroxy-6-metoxy-1,4-benzoquinol methylase
LVAHEKFSLNVFQGTLEEAEFPDEHFDTITMNHVIEHVPDPIKVLEECRRELKPGGRLVVVTPNIKCLGHYIFRENWRGLEVPRHLFLFSLPSLRACAEAAGLEASELRTTARRAP